MDILLDILINFEEEKLHKHQENVRFHKKLIYNALLSENYKNIRINKRILNDTLKSYNAMTNLELIPSKFKKMEEKNEFPIIIENGNPYQCYVLNEIKEKEFFEYFFSLFD